MNLYGYTCTFSGPGIITFHRDMKDITCTLEKGKEGLWYVTSKDVNGLLVAGKVVDDELLSNIAKALVELECVEHLQGGSPSIKPRGYGAFKDMYKFDPGIDLTKPIYEQRLHKDVVESIDGADLRRRIEAILSPAIDVKAPYAQQMVDALLALHANNNELNP